MSDLTASFPRVWPIRTEAESAAAASWQPTSGLPMPPNHFVTVRDKLAGVVVHGFPMTYFRFHPDIGKLREAAMVATMFDNLNRTSGLSWSVTFVDDDCPFGPAMPELGYTDAKGKLWWKGL